MKSTSKIKTGRIVLPGDRVGVIEEFIPLQGLYDDKGVLYSSRIGVMLVDVVERRVSIHPLKDYSAPHKGDVVLGQASNVMEDVAMIKVIEIEGKPPLSGFLTGFLHISQVVQGFEESMFNVVKVGDYVKAKVLTSWHPLQLSIKRRDLGVIYALCSSCRSELIKMNGGLYCSLCKSYEKRKVAAGYLLRKVYEPKAI